MRGTRGDVERAGRCMGSIIKSIGHGLLAAGILLIVIYGLGAYLRGREAFRDALDPTAMKTYLALLRAAPRTGRVIQARQGNSFCPESGTGCRSKLGSSDAYSGRTRRSSVCAGSCSFH